ncbi:hypothetical protein FGG08_002791 [Glutinoglossum americanum]|uniref:Uncharacterized protein n=1 Tax=Glutinoglossum americanum TaxID=1670608 RepID=A0A9P8IC91_9PEZI|nr:hypothetical protein FGG08_002791 [Glutinoglossum americanum]
MTMKAKYAPLGGALPEYSDEIIRDDPSFSSSSIPLPETLSYTDNSEVEPVLPAYSDDPSPASAAAIATNPEAGRIPNSVVSSDRITITTLDEGLNEDPAKLHSFVLQQNEIPPKPTVQIVGTHHETRRQSTKDGKDERVKVTDFDIQLDLTPYIARSLNLGCGEQDWKFLSVVENGVKAYRGGRIKSLDPGHRDGLTSYAAPHLGDWTKAYCGDPNILKSFTFSKTVSNFDTEKLISLLTALIESTNYRGHYHITFTTTHSRIQVLSPHWINRLRTKTWVRWLFYLSMLWIFTWPLLWFLTRRYEVVTSAWPYALIDEQGQKRYAVASEEDWYRRYAVVIRRSLLMRRQGWVTDEDLRLCESGISSGGNAPVSAAESRVMGFAFGLVHGVTGASRDLDAIRGWGADS